MTEVVHVPKVRFAKGPVRITEPEPPVTIDAEAWIAKHGGYPEQVFTVPPGSPYLAQIDVWAGGGGHAGTTFTSHGGIPVKPGETISIRVGGRRSGKSSQHARGLASDYVIADEAAGWDTPEGDPMYDLYRARLEVERQQMMAYSFSDMQMRIIEMMAEERPLTRDCTSRCTRLTGILKDISCSRGHKP